MKLRIKESTLRLRLTKSEIEKLKQEGFVEEQTIFGPEHIFTYRIEIDQENAILTAAMTPAKINIFLPQAKAATWLDTELVSLKEHIDNGENGLYILIEKDFQCLHREWENKEDLFLNPNLDN